MRGNKNWPKIHSTKKGTRKWYKLSYLPKVSVTSLGFGFVKISQVGIAGQHSDEVLLDSFPSQTLGSTQPQHLNRFS